MGIFAKIFADSEKHNAELQKAWEEKKAKEASEKTQHEAELAAFHAAHPEPIRKLQLPKHDHSEEYKAALQSKRWKLLRRIHISENDGKCAQCNSAPLANETLELHHLTYERIGKEKFSDVILLCRCCHERADKIRERKSKCERDSKLYNARLDGWARKVYGDDWTESHDPEAVADIFDRWLERQGQ